MFSIAHAVLIGVAMVGTVTMQQADEIDSCSASTAQAGLGQAVVQNTCSFAVYLQSVAGTDISSVITLNPGMAYQEDYHNGPDGTGVAIKITKDLEDWSTPMLLEYSPSTEMNLVFYDMSVSVGGNETGDGGIGTGYQLNPSMVDPTIDCVPVNFNDSYVHLGENDDATKSCLLSTTITLELC